MKQAGYLPDRENHELHGQVGHSGSMVNTDQRLENFLNLHFLSTQLFCDREMYMCVLLYI